MIRLPGPLGLATIALAISVVPGSALAQTIVFGGYTNGCFGACSPVDLSTFQSSTVFKSNSKLTFVNATFGGTAPWATWTRIGDDPNGEATQEINNFGAFYLTRIGTPPTPDVYDEVFTLAVRWTDPGTNTGIFTAAVTGLIRVAGDRIEILFGSNTQTFSFIDPVTGNFGTVRYEFRDNLALIGPNLTVGTVGVPIIGEAFITVVPEPATISLLGTGLFGLAGLARRRLRQRADESLTSA